MKNEENLIVISGINLFEGGPLSIYYDCLDELIIKKIYVQKKIVAFVHKKELFLKYKDYITIIELPKSRKNYLYRLWYEYVYFNQFSKSNNVLIWLSLHDITPRVKSKYIFTYCHNPSIFLKVDLKTIYLSFTNFLFSFLYYYLYRINIKKATGIIVQQNWIRRKFLKMFPLTHVIVAYPHLAIEEFRVNTQVNNDKCIWIYPAFPRTFKNFEVICKAVSDIQDLEFEIWLTIDGTENQYSKMLYSKYGHLKNIRWLGSQSRDNLFKMYSSVSGLIFPSKLETWGLPISEFKQTGKDIILSDLEYAHETLGEYSKAVFFNPNNHIELSQILRSIIEKKITYHRTHTEFVQQPFCKNWDELLTLLLSYN